MKELLCYAGFMLCGGWIAGVCVMALLALKEVYGKRDRTRQNQ